VRARSYEKDIQQASANKRGKLQRAMRGKGKEKGFAALCERRAELDDKTLHFDSRRLAHASCFVLQRSL
jgi:hypothetical protein